MSEGEDDDNFGVFNFGDILTELQINSDAEEVIRNSILRKFLFNKFCFQIFRIYFLLTITRKLFFFLIISILNHKKIFVLNFFFQFWNTRRCVFQNFFQFWNTRKCVFQNTWSTWVVFHWNTRLVVFQISSTRPHVFQKWSISRTHLEHTPF